MAMLCPTVQLSSRGDRAKSRLCSQLTGGYGLRLIVSMSDSFDEVGTIKVSILHLVNGESYKTSDFAPASLLRHRYRLGFCVRFSLGPGCRHRRRHRPTPHTIDKSILNRIIDGSAAADWDVSDSAAGDPADDEPANHNDAYRSRSRR